LTKGSGILVRNLGENGGGGSALFCFGLRGGFFFVMHGEKKAALGLRGQGGKLVETEGELERGVYKRAKRTSKRGENKFRR